MSILLPLSGLSRAFPGDGGSRQEAFFAQPWMEMNALQPRCQDRLDPLCHGHLIVIQHGSCDEGLHEIRFLTVRQVVEPRHGLLGPVAIGRCISSAVCGSIVAAGFPTFPRALSSLLVQLADVEQVPEQIIGHEVILDGDEAFVGKIGEGTVEDGASDRFQDPVSEVFEPLVRLEGEGVGLCSIAIDRSAVFSLSHDETDAIEAFELPSIDAKGEALEL